MKRIFRLSIIFLLAAPPARAAVDLGEIVVTASRMAQYDYKIAGNVSVIDSDEIAASNARNIPELLRQELGVQVYDNGTPKTAILDVRGFADAAPGNVLVMVDDRKINNVDLSGPDLMRIPLGEVERVEIIRGAGSVLYGDNAVGGVINIITKKGKGDFHAKAGDVYGSYATRQQDVEASGEYKDVSYYSYARLFDTNGYRENSGVQAQDFHTRLGAKFSEMLSVDMNVGWHKDDTELPGGMTITEMNMLGRRGSSNVEDFVRTTDRYINIVFNVDPFSGGTEAGRIVIDTNYRNRDVYDAFFTGGEFSTKRAIDSKGLTVKYIFDRPIFRREVNFVTGLDYYNHTNDILGSGFNPDDLTIKKQEFGTFGFLQLETLDDVFLNGGLRYHRADYAFHQRNVIIDAKQRPDEWVYMGGLRYEYAQGSSIYCNAQKTFRFLATDEWYSAANFPSFGIFPGLDLSLKQQTGMQYEIGVKHVLNEMVALTVTPYLMDIRNEIFFNPVSFSNDNYDKTRRRGIELGTTVDLQKLVGLEGRILDKLQFYSNYTYQQSRFLKGPNDGKDIPMVPRYEVSSGIVTRLAQHFEASLTGRYVGARFIVNDIPNVFPPMKPYALMDAKFAFQNKDWEIFAAVNNVTGKKYFSYVAKSAFSNAVDFFPAQERSFTVGVSKKF